VSVLSGRVLSERCSKIIHLEHGRLDTVVINHIRERGRVCPRLSLHAWRSPHTIIRTPMVIETSCAIRNNSTSPAQQDDKRHEVSSALRRRPSGTGAVLSITGKGCDQLRKAVRLRLCPALRLYCSLYKQCNRVFFRPSHFDASIIFPAEAMRFSLLLPQMLGEDRSRVPLRGTEAHQCSLRHV
jgi:hypothetical protein